MTRNARISFMKELSNGTPTIVVMEEIDTHMLRLAILGELTEFSVAIVELGEPRNDGVYEERQQMIRILDRLDQRPHMTEGRSFMCADGMRFTVGEVQIVQRILNKTMAKTVNELESFNRANSQPTIYVLQRKESLDRLMKHVLNAHGLKPPTK